MCFFALASSSLGKDKGLNQACREERRYFKAHVGSQANPERRVKIVPYFGLLFCSDQEEISPLLSSKLSEYSVSPSASTILSFSEKMEV